ncbi:TPA: gp53-like domain-containing protein [Enterobacter roggenkampii]
MDNGSARLAKDRNLSDLPNTALARQNLELGDSSTRNVGTTAGTVASGDDARITGAMQKSQNGGDIPDVAKFLQNLGFVGSLTSPGYAVIPLGTKKLVIQWGTVTVPTAGSASATYPLALDLGLAQFCTPIDVSSINNYRVGVATSTKASITLASTNTQSVTGVMWLSIGTIN